MPKIAKNKNYLTQETEDAIILYNKTSDHAVKDKIYQKYIHYPFFKLTQNIIHTFKFYNTEVDNLEHVQHEIEVFLLGKLHLYNHSQNIQDRLVKIITKEFQEEYNSDFKEFVGDVDKITQQQINDFLSTINVSKECMEKLSKMTPPKAYSYFGTIVKRWCIIYNNKIYNSKTNQTPIDELNQDHNPSYTPDLSPSDDKLFIFMESYIEYLDSNIENLFHKQQDREIADSILELFRKRDQIDIFNKKALYIYIHEMVPEAKTPRITKIANSLYDVFKRNYVFYLENSYIKFN
jgi:hypothetical protein